MLLIVTNILKFIVKHYRSIIAIIAILIAVASLLFTYLKLKKTQKYDEQATSLLKKIEFVEELTLTTYYFEEVITIGTRARVSKLVDKAEEKLKKLEEVLYSSEFDLAQAESQKDSAIDAYYVVDTMLTDLRTKLRLARVYYKDINKAFFIDVKKALNDNSQVFGPSVQSAFLAFQKAQTDLDDARGSSAKRQARRTLNLAEEKLKADWETEKDKRRNTRDKYLEEYELLRTQQQKREKDLRKIKDDAIRKYDKALKRFEKDQAKVDEQIAILAKARDELKKAIEKDEDVEPKLLIVVPAKINGFIDMRKLRFQEIGIGDGHSGDTLLVILPPPQIDSVITDLDSTANYRLDKMLNLDASTSNDGFYYDIFQQLRQALKETEDLVRDKAIDAGIYAETHRLAAAYVTEFAGSLGYTVQFVNHFPTENRAHFDSTYIDPTRRIFDSTREVIPHEELMKIIPLDSGSR